MDSGDLDAVSAILGATAASPLLARQEAFGADYNSMMKGRKYSSFDMSDSATGHLLLDALLLTAVPVVLQFLLWSAGIKQAWKRLRAVVFGDEDDDFVIRVVKAKTTFGEYCIQGSISDRYAHLLQRVIMAHITDLIGNKLRGRDIQYELIEKEMDDDAAQMLEDLQMTPNDDSDDDYYDSDDDDLPSKHYEAINRLRVGSMPTQAEWVEVQPRVFFMHSIASGQGDDVDDNTNSNDDDAKAKIVKSKDITSTFWFKTDAKDGTKVIDKLIDDAFVKYQLLQLAALANDKKKYMYVQTQRIVATPADDDDDNDGETTEIVVYKRYALGEEKTFGNLFFDEKKSLVQLLDNFLNKTGKFSITGFPYKLGLLLYGPPGTGKTSLIKAVAHHTKRHIVTISLGKIKTNQELMNALFDLRFSVEGVSLPVNMTFEDVVFVMEDIDCAASVVMARENKPSKARRYKRSSQWGSSANDKLNLSGLLNVLDGVIDCPGRIVIMTTNHPEKLDPALIRPGRINKKLELGYMSADNVQTMVEYYSQEKFTREQEAVLTTMLSAENAKPITPATVEALSAEFDDIDSVLEALRALQAAPDGRDAWLR